MSAPAVEDELVLGLAGTAQRRESEARRLQALVGRVEPARLTAVLARQRLIHLGVARLAELGGDELAAAVEGPLEARRAAMRFKGVEQEMLTHAIVGLLDQHGITSVPLKGAVLARRLFDDPGLRESDDIDLLVALANLDRAVALVRHRFGYDPPRDPLGAGGRPLLHYGLMHPDGLPTVELHWRVHWYEERSGAAMIGRSTAEHGLRRLAPADELACLLLVYARDGFAGIRPLADLAAWWDRLGDQLPADGLAPFVGEFPELALALSVAATLADALAGIPRSMLGLAGHSMSWRSRRAIRLANWRLTGSDEQIFADIALADLLLTPPTDIPAFIRRQVVLPLDVVADRLLQGPARRRDLLRAAALHVPRILARFVLAALATSGRRTRSGLPRPDERRPHTLYAETRV